MDARLLAQLALVLDCEAQAAVPDPYAIPRVQPTLEQAAEATRLTTMGDVIFRRAKAAGFGKGPDGSGSDAAFGYLVEQYRTRGGTGS